MTATRRSSTRAELELDAGEAFYRLGTAVMVAHVLLDNDAPPEARARHARRVALLVEAIATGERPDHSFIPPTGPTPARRPR